MKKTVYQKPSWKDLDMEIEGYLLLTSYGDAGSAGAGLVEDPEDVYEL